MTEDLLKLFKQALRLNPYLDGQAKMKWESEAENMSDDQIKIYIDMINARSTEEIDIHSKQLDDDQVAYNQDLLKNVNKGVNKIFKIAESQASDKRELHGEELLEKLDNI